MTSGHLSWVNIMYPEMGLAFPSVNRELDTLSTMSATITSRPVRFLLCHRSVAPIEHEENLKLRLATKAKHMSRPTWLARPRVHLYHHPNSGGAKTISLGAGFPFLASQLNRRYFSDATNDLWLAESHTWGMMACETMKTMKTMTKILNNLIYRPVM